MKTLYISQSHYSVSLAQEQLQVKRGKELITSVKLPLLEQVLVFGKAQITTQAIHACLTRHIPILYLSRMGYCYGRVLSIAQGYRHLSRYQQSLGWQERLATAQVIVNAKLKNSRVILQRQYRKRPSDELELAINGLEHLSRLSLKADTLEQLMGYEGSGANYYFAAWAECIENTDFVFLGRSRRPPGNPVNALLSFGYQVLWNHVLTLLELQGLDPYQGCLHQGSDRHAALVSDLIEEFRAPIVDSLVLYLINRRLVNAVDDFVFRDGGCFLNESGRKKWLKAFVQRMDEKVTIDQDINPRWYSLLKQVKGYKAFIYSPVVGYQPYLIR